MATERRYTHPALVAGNVAVITGGCSGIGLAMAKRCTALGMRVVLGDLQVGATIAELGFPVSQQGQVLQVKCDVTDPISVEQLLVATMRQHGACHFLFCNCGIGGGGGPFTNLGRWKEVMDVNMWGVLHCLNTFVPHMLKQAEPSVIATTASRAGVTCPPGDTAYNVSKSAVRIITEALQHRLRNTPNCNTTAHLLLPGMTHTNISRHATARLRGPEAAAKLPRSDGANTTMGKAAVLPHEVADVLLDAIERRSFYAICSDGEQSKRAFQEAVRWYAEDVAAERVPLSRWHEPHRQQYLDRVAKL